MWARVTEVMLAVWLALSVFIFPADESPSQWSLYAVATLIATLALLSYWRPTARAHLVIFAVAIGMYLWGRFLSSAPPGSGYQNVIAVALLLMMFAIVPNDCLRPPRVWREVAAEGSGRG